MSTSPARVTIKIDLRPFNQALARAAEAVRRFSLALNRAGRKGRPVSLSTFGVDGHEYHRRRKARARRR